MDNEEIPEELETNVECPSCGKNLFLTYYATEIAYEEKVTIQTFFCKSCLYKTSTILPNEERKPKQIYFKISSPDDLRIVVYRSPKASIFIPELGAEILAGKASQGEITTVEGIIYRIKTHFEMMARDEEESKDIKRMSETIDNILEGKEEDFTIIIEDPSGKSKINSSRAIELELKDSSSEK